MQTFLARSAALRAQKKIFPRQYEVLARFLYILAITSRFAVCGNVPAVLAGSGCKDRPALPASVQPSGHPRYRVDAFTHVIDLHAIASIRKFNIGIIIAAFYTVIRCCYFAARTSAMICRGWKSKIIYFLHCNHCLPSAIVDFFVGRTLRECASPDHSITDLLRMSILFSTHLALDTAA